MTHRVKASLFQKTVPISTAVSNATTVSFILPGVASLALDIMAGAVVANSLVSYPIISNSSQLWNLESQREMAPGTAASAGDRQFFISNSKVSNAYLSLNQAQNLVIVGFNPQAPPTLWSFIQNGSGAMLIGTCPAAAMDPTAICNGGCIHVQTSGGVRSVVFTQGYPNESCFDPTASWFITYPPAGC